MSLFQVKSSVLLPLLQSLGRPQPLLTETVGGKKLFPSSDDTDNTVCSTVLNLPNLEIIGLLILVLCNSIIYQSQEIFDKYLQTDVLSISVVTFTLKVFCSVTRMSWPVLGVMSTMINLQILRWMMTGITGTEGREVFRTTETPQGNVCGES